MNARLYHFFINAFNHESANRRVSFKQLQEDNIKLACNMKPERAEGSRELRLVAFAFKLASRAQWMQLLGLSGVARLQRGHCCASASTRVSRKPLGISSCVVSAT